MLSHFNLRMGKVATTILFGFGLSIAAQLLVVLPARADCEYEGKKYKTGETVGPYVCMPDGKWQQR